MMGSPIIKFLSSVTTGTCGTENRQGITIEANALEDDKEYQVCTSFKKNGSKQQ